MKLETAIRKIELLRDEAKEREDDYLRRYQREYDEELADSLWAHYIANSDSRIAYDDCLNILMEVRKECE